MYNISGRIKGVHKPFNSLNYFCQHVLVGCVYNFCTPQQNLRLPLYLPDGRRRWVKRTPAMAAGITGDIWTVEQLLSYQVPLPPWQPPRRRGRRSAKIKACIERYDL